MVYAYPSNRPFVTMKPLKKRIVSDGARKRMEFCSTHAVIVHVDAKTKEAHVEIDEYRFTSDKSDVKCYPMYYDLSVEE